MGCFPGFESTLTTLSPLKYAAGFDFIFISSFPNELLLVPAEKKDIMQDRETVVLPRQPDHTSSAALAKLSIIKVMEFTSQTLRSGVVVWSDDGPKGSALLFLRGAPAMIRDLVQPASVPANFNQVGSMPTF